jgi:hypothetical protein
MGVVVHEGAFVDERIEFGPRVLVDALVEVALVLVFYRSERHERDAKETQKKHEKRYKRGKRMSYTKHYTKHYTKGETRGICQCCYRAIGAIWACPVSYVWPYHGNIFPRVSLCRHSYPYLLNH